MLRCKIEREFDGKREKKMSFTLLSSRASEQAKDPSWLLILSFHPSTQVISWFTRTSHQLDTSFTPTVCGRSWYPQCSSYGPQASLPIRSSRWAVKPSAAPSHPGRPQDVHSTPSVRTHRTHRGAPHIELDHWGRVCDKVSQRCTNISKWSSWGGSAACRSLVRKVGEDFAEGDPGRWDLVDTS